MMAANLMKGLLGALQHLHKQEIIYRKLSPDNISLTSDRGKRGVPGCGVRLKSCEKGCKNVANTHRSWLMEMIADFEILGRWLVLEGGGELLKSDVLALFSQLFFPWLTG